MLIHCILNLFSFKVPSSLRQKTVMSYSTILTSYIIVRDMNRKGKG